MKIDNGPLRSYLVKNLTGLTEADPQILADYVSALLANNKPKKELQQLCTDNLLDFLGQGTKPFVTKLFQAIEDGSIAAQENAKPAVAPAPGPAESMEAKSSPAKKTEESSDDEDDDRNHKHRRPRSRSFDKDGEEYDRDRYRKRSRSTENGQYNRDSYNHRRYRGGREPVFGSRIVADGAVRGGVRANYAYRRDPAPPRMYGSGMPRGMGRARGIGNGSWLPSERFGSFADGSEFPSVLGPSASSIFGARVPGGRGGPHQQWTGFASVPGIGNGTLEHAIPLTPGTAVNAGSGISMVLPMRRQRCLDFEERGYCLRGDLCPMEHGANRIVVEDVQSLSQLTLPGSANTTAGANVKNGATPAEAVGRSRQSRETPAAGNGAATSSAGHMDLYDPDQPLWSKTDAQGQEQVEGQQKQEWENAPNDEMKAGDAGVSVWDRIGPGGRKVGNMVEAGADGNGVIVVPRAAERSSYAGRGDRGEKAQRTLYVRCIPSDLNKSDLLRAHFQKFGEVIDVRIPLHGDDRAFVQFARREDAETALLSPEAVLGNRFIRVSWANRDNKVDSSRLHKDAAAAPQAEVKPPQHRPSVTAAQLQKQEELEQIREEIRKKQEALAQKREEFKKKLNMLSKQEVTTSTENGNASEKQQQPAPKVSKAPPAATAPAAPAPVSAAAAQATPAAASSAALPAARPSNPASTWGPARYKIDNRTTTFRISAPPAAALEDMSGLKAHFSSYGDLSGMEVHEEEGGQQRNSSSRWVQVSFATRRDAERAFAQGRVWQGLPLDLSWLDNRKPPSRVAAESEQSQSQSQPQQQQQQQQA